MKLKYVFICLLTLSFLVSCKSKKKIAQKSNKTKNEVVIQQDNDTEVITKTPKTTSIQNATITYINKYKDVAMDEMRAFDIPASITLAQGILESGSGRSELTRKSNNHFGIKCHKEWNGKKTYHDDDEKGECFRVYKDPRKSFRDHSLFLTERKRYSKLFKHEKGDYVKWAKGLSEAGYATDRRYPAKLIALIEKYDLHKYDTEVLGKPYIPIVENESESPTHHKVVKGDTLYSISRRYGLTVNELKKINGLNSNDISIGQTLVLIK